MRDNEKTYPKVLVISHNAFNETSNMGKTLLSLFNGWDINNMSQFFFHSDYPSFDICNSYYCVTDYDVAKSLIKRTSPGKVVIQGEEHTVNKQDDIHLYASSKRNLPLVHLLRNFVWNKRKWKTQELYKWIESFNPDVIFYASGDYNFSMKVAMQIKKDFKKPMLVFFGDEYYLLRNKKMSLINLINKYNYKKTFKKLFSVLDYFITASEQMERKYKEIFLKQGSTLMTPSQRYMQPRKGQDIIISYIGNIGCGRWKAIIELGACLASLGLELQVYSGAKDKKAIEKITDKRGINFKGSISSKEVMNVIAESTIIVHLESMTKAMQDLVRYSMSTKIAESLWSGVCLFAYGPKNVSSIEYLKENDAACVVNDKSQLKKVLGELIVNEELRNKYIENALILAEKNHNKEVNENRIYEIICELVNDSGGKYENIANK